MTTQTRFFYKGTQFPIALVGENTAQEIIKNANEMIIMGLRMNISLEEQKKDYKEQLDMIEQKLFDIGSTQNKSKIKKGLTNIAKYLNSTIDDIHSMWMLNVCALLKMKVIENDNMNGLMTIRF